MYYIRMVLCVMYENTKFCFKKKPIYYLYQYIAFTDKVRDTNVLHTHNAL